MNLNEAFKELKSKGVSRKDVAKMLGSTTKCMNFLCSKAARTRPGSNRSKELEKIFNDHGINITFDEIHFPNHDTWGA